METYQAIAILKLLEIQNVSKQIEQELELGDKVEIEAGKAYAAKRPKMNFVKIGIPVGSELVFINGGEVAEVLSERTIKFPGEESSITQATRSSLDYGYS
jgi:hypothetical protein